MFELSVVHERKKMFAVRKERLLTEKRKEKHSTRQIIRLSGGKIRSSPARPWYPGTRFHQSGRGDVTWRTHRVRTATIVPSRLRVIDVLTACICPAFRSVCATLCPRKPRFRKGAIMAHKTLVRVTLEWTSVRIRNENATQMAGHWGADAARSTRNRSRRGRLINSWFL